MAADAGRAAGVVGAEGEEAVDMVAAGALQTCDAAWAPTVMALPHSSNPLLLQACSGCDSLHAGSLGLRMPACR